MTQRDWIEKDFYRELGVASGASQDEIKKAYRKLARELHPDANPGDAKAEARFKSVSEAYGVLSDEKKRREYDETRALFAGGGGLPGRFPGGAGGFPGGEAVPRRRRADVRHERPVRQHRRRRPGPGRPARRDLRRRRRGAAARGRRRPADSAARTSRASCGSTSPRPSGVPRCRSGSRRPGAARRVPAPVRGRAPRRGSARPVPGRGLVSRNEGAFAFSEPCPDCRGTGRIIDDPCPECGGDGVSTRTRSLTIRVPAGVDDGQRIKLAGQGEPGRGGAPAGDLYVKVHVTPHRVFGRSKDNPDDLVVTVPVTYPELVLGSTIDVPTLDGSVTLRIPAGTQSGKTFRVRGPRRAEAHRHRRATCSSRCPWPCRSGWTTPRRRRCTTTPRRPRASTRGRTCCDAGGDDQGLRGR